MGEDMRHNTHPWLVGLLTHMTTMEIRKMGIRLMQDLIIQLLGICLILPQTLAQTQILISTLFIEARNYKQPECPLTDEWIKQI